TDSTLLSTLSLHDALPISPWRSFFHDRGDDPCRPGASARTLTEFRALATDFKRSAGVRVGARTKFHAQRRADQPELVPEPALEIAPVGLGHVLQRAAVHDDDRGILPALVGVAHLGADRAATRGLLSLDRLVQRAG